MPNYTLNEMLDDTNARCSRLEIEINEYKGKYHDALRLRQQDLDRIAQLEPANALLQDQVCALANRKDLLEAALEVAHDECKYVYGRLAQARQLLQRCLDDPGGSYTEAEGAAVVKLWAEVESWLADARMEHTVACSVTETDGDDAPELTGEELNRPDAKWKIGGKEVTPEEGKAAFRERLSSDRAVKHE